MGRGKDIEFIVADMEVGKGNYHGMVHTFRMKELGLEDRQYEIEKELNELTLISRKLCLMCQVSSVPLIDLLQ